MCASSLALFAQSLEISSRPMSPTQVTVLISIVSPQQNDVVGLQWETTFPAQVGVDGNRPEPSDAARAAGKSLMCSTRKAMDFQWYKCILIGGQKPIKNGPVAVFKIHLLSDAQADSTVRVSHAEVVTKDLQEILLRDVEAKVTVKH
jgi:hypothetical protein